MPTNFAYLNKTPATQRPLTSSPDTSQLILQDAARRAAAAGGQGRTEANNQATNFQNTMRPQLTSAQVTTDPNGNRSVTENYGGGGSSGARNGIAIGGSVYPDITQMYGQIGGDVRTPNRPSAPQVPMPNSGFAHAKDVAGRQGNKAIDALRNMMTRRGISDSGVAATGEANILGQVARQGAEAEYDAANVANDRQWEANQMDYQGQLAHNDLDVRTQMANRSTKEAILRALMAQLY